MLHIKYCILIIIYINQMGIMKKITMILNIFVLSLSLVACFWNEEEKQETSKNKSTQNQAVTRLKVEIPLKSRSGDILEGQNYLKINYKETPTKENLIKIYNELNKSDLNFNYYIIQHGNQGMHFMKNVHIVHLGEIDFDCVPLQPGSQLKETTKYLTIEGNKI